jgi:hypothetical protein
MAAINDTDYTGKQPRPIGFLSRQPKNNNFQEITAFKLTISKIPETTYFCQTANIPGIGITPVQQETIFNPILYPGGKVEHEDFSVRFQVSEGLHNWLEIYKWIQSCSTYTDFDKIAPLEQTLVSDAQLYVLTSKNNLELSVRFYNLFPKSISSIEFDYSDADLQTILCNASFAFSHYEIIT